MGLKCFMSLLSYTKYPGRENLVKKTKKKENIQNEANPNAQLQTEHEMHHIWGQKFRTFWFLLTL